MQTECNRCKNGVCIKGWSKFIKMLYHFGVTEVWMCTGLSSAAQCMLVRWRFHQSWQISRRRLVRHTLINQSIWKMVVVIFLNKITLRWGIAQLVECLTEKPGAMLTGVGVMSHFCDNATTQTQPNATDAKTGVCIKGWSKFTKMLYHFGVTEVRMCTGLSSAAQCMPVRWRFHQSWQISRRRLVRHTLINQSISQHWKMVAVIFLNKITLRWGNSSAGGASDWKARRNADRGWSQEIFLPESTSSADLRCPYSPPVCNHAHQHLCPR